MSFNDLVKGNKLPVLFIGSGFSKRYLNSPNWEALLMRVYQYLGKNTIDYKSLKLKTKNKRENRNLSTGEINAIIAEEIEMEFNNYFYESDLVHEFPEWVEKEVNPFRKCIASILDELELLEEKQEEIEAFKELKNKIKSVITTNYDTLLEDLFDLPKDSTFIGQPQLFSPNSMEIGELYKIHGCMTESDNIVITSRDYSNFRSNAKLFSAKLLTLISENPVVFIGYSISDPNIQQTLSDLIRCLSEEQINNLKSHFYVIEFNEGVKEIEEKELLFHAQSYQGETTTFPITVISTDNYLGVYKKLNELTPAMNLDTVKQVKRIVKDIVVDAVESKEKTDVQTIFMDDINKLKQTDQKFAIAIGNIKDINSNYGYNLRPVEEVLEDILFDNKNFNSERLIKETYEKSYLKIKRIIPIYKYLRKLSKEEVEEKCPNVYNYVSTHLKKDDYLNSNIIRSLKNIPVGNKMDDMPPSFKGNTYKTSLWLIKNFELLPLEEIKILLQKEFDNYGQFNSNQQSSYRRLVSLYDLFQYK
ncbi:SIR2 family protein [Lentibacillus jeotgali]|uniref:SIR2 family protein n=1 Tax=Lentibacillus jeotgali TaxID=558169 RepID=UPI0002627037|nr:SIR2 family protein [Lentibacillus jeotgali]